MDATCLPPSLRVTPGRIAQYLSEGSVRCECCGYPLRGLPEPRCPECGGWTNLYQRLRRRNLQRIADRLGSWGTVDHFLVERSGDRIVNVISFDEISDIDVAARWHRHTRLWMGVLGAAALAATPGLFLLLAWNPGFSSGVCLLGHALVGYTLLHLAFILEPQWWVRVHTAGGPRKIPLRYLGGSEARRGAARWRQAIARGRRPPDEASETAQIDEEAASMDAGRCPRCGYDLHGPRLMVEAPNRATQSAGVILVIVGGVFLPCCGLGNLVNGSSLTAGLPGFVPCAALLGLSASGIGLGIWLFRRKRPAPAVPSWPGPGSCSACGWRAPAAGRAGAGAATRSGRPGIGPSLR